MSGCQGCGTDEGIVTVGVYSVGVGDLGPKKRHMDEGTRPSRSDVIMLWYLKLFVWFPNLYVFTFELVETRKKFKG